MRLGMDVSGFVLINVNIAVGDVLLYVLEVNSRASRPVPFVRKSLGVTLAKLAMRVMMGELFDEKRMAIERQPSYFSVKEAVFPFNKFPGTDVLLGPEMRSTGEVMGIAGDFGSAFLKSQAAAGSSLPMSGRIFISVKDKDKPGTVTLTQRFLEFGFAVEATRGTAAYLSAHGVTVEP